MSKSSACVHPPEKPLTLSAACTHDEHGRHQAAWAVLPVHLEL